MSGVPYKMLFNSSKSINSPEKSSKLKALEPCASAAFAKYEFNTFSNGVSRWLAKNTSAPLDIKPVSVIRYISAHDQHGIP